MKIEERKWKVKDKLPFKWFECGRICHYAYKCPYAKINDNGDESIFKSKHKKRKKASKKSNFYSKEQSDNESNGSVTNEEIGEILFITKDEEPEVEFDYKGELISALWEIKSLRKKEGHLMPQFQDKNLNEDIILSLKDELKEEKRVKEFLFE